MADIWILDWKSSTGIWDEMKTQVCCYQRMANKDLDLKIPADTRVGIVRLDKTTGLLDDPPVVEVTDIEERWQAFLHLREYFRILIEPTISDKKKERWYPYLNKKFPTITTINDILNKPSLVQWSANMTVDYLNLHYREMVGLEIVNGEPRIIFNEELEKYHFKKAKTAYRQISKEAMDIGSIVHDAIHAHLSGAKADDILKGNDKAENAFLAFLEWGDKAKLKPIALEKVLIDPEHEIGGTCDYIGEMEI